LGPADKGRMIEVAQVQELRIEDIMCLIGPKPECRRDYEAYCREGGNDPDRRAVYMVSVFDSVHLSFEASAEGGGHGYGLSTISELILHEIHLPCHSYLNDNADEEFDSWNTLRSGCFIGIQLKIGARESRGLSQFPVVISIVLYHNIKKCLYRTAPRIH